MPRPPRVLISAGNTREMMDPVRYLSNVSTGVMGFELAKASRKAGFPTTLVAGPNDLKKPSGVRMIGITTSGELAKVLRKEFARSDILFMTSAVCDFSPVKVSSRKIKRKPFLTLKLVKTPDILSGLARRRGRRTVVGFCLETENLIANARRKLREKRVDYMVANYLGRGSTPFGPHRTSVTILSKNGKSVSLRNVTKAKVARFLIASVLGNRVVGKRGRPQ